MKTILTPLIAACLLLCLPIGLSATGTNAANAPGAISMEKSNRVAEKEWKSMQKSEKQAQKHEIKNAIKAHKAGDMSDDMLLLVIITILLPPLGMYLYEGEITGRFWISLLLTLLFYLPGLIYTLVIILGDK